MGEQKKWVLFTAPSLVTSGLKKRQTFKYNTTRTTQQQKTTKKILRVLNKERIHMSRPPCSSHLDYSYHIKRAQSAQKLNNEKTTGHFETKKVGLLPKRSTARRIKNKNEAYNIIP